jgi:hypothetical protein
VAYPPVSRGAARLGGGSNLDGEEGDRSQVDDEQAAEHHVEQRRRRHCTSAEEPDEEQPADGNREPGGEQRGGMADLVLGDRLPRVAVAEEEGDEQRRRQRRNSNTTQDRPPGAEDCRRTDERDDQRQDRVLGRNQLAQVLCVEEHHRVGGPQKRVDGQVARTAHRLEHLALHGRTSGSVARSAVAKKVRMLATLAAIPPPMLMASAQRSGPRVLLILQSLSGRAVGTKQLLPCCVAPRRRPSGS